MPSMVDERGYNQGFKLTPAQLCRLRRRALAIVNALPAGLNQPRILELGCGTGELAHELAALLHGEVTGVDLSEKFIKVARERYSDKNLNFECVDLTEPLALSQNSGYDAIVGNGILHHLYHRLDSVLDALNRLLKPGGILAFWEPNVLNPYVYAIFKFPIGRNAARLEPDEEAFSPSFISALLNRKGFTNIRAETRDFLLPVTPACMITAAAKCSDVLDHMPMVKWLAQSIFITANSAGEFQPSPAFPRKNLRST